MLAREEFGSWPVREGPPEHGDNLLKVTGNRHQCNLSGGSNLKAPLEPVPVGFESQGPWRG